MTLQIVVLQVNLTIIYLYLFPPAEPVDVYTADLDNNGPPMPPPLPFEDAAAPGSAPTDSTTGSSPNTADQTTTSPDAGSSPSAESPAAAAPTSGASSAFRSLTAAVVVLAAGALL